jgi:hypothetical protein
MPETIKILNYRGISMMLSGSPNVIREDRFSPKYSKEVEELVEFVRDWTERNSNGKKTIVTITK